MVGIELFMGGGDRERVRTTIYIDMVGWMRKEESTIVGLVEAID